MQVLGIDPGTRLMGYGLIHVDKGKMSCLSYGRIKLPVEQDLSWRLHVLDEEVQELLKNISPDVVAIESLFVSKNVMSSLKLAHARGVLLSIFAKRLFPIKEFAPRAIKKAVVGKGQATKEQIQYMMKEIFKLQTVPKADAADALAIALCCANHHWMNPL